jgi:hypothetical protein
MRAAIVFEASRDGYGIDQIADKAITIGELKRLIDDFDDDDLFVLSHDNGYTYGSISSWKMSEAEEQSDGEWEVY